MLNTTLYWTFCKQIILLQNSGLVLPWCWCVLLYCLVFCKHDVTDISHSKGYRIYPLINKVINSKYSQHHTLDNSQEPICLSPPLCFFTSIIFCASFLLLPSSLSQIRHVMALNFYQVSTTKSANHPKTIQLLVFKNFLQYARRLTTTQVSAWTYRTVWKYSRRKIMKTLCKSRYAVPKMRRRLEFVVENMATT